MRLPLDPSSKQGDSVGATGQRPPADPASSSHDNEPDRGGLTTKRRRIFLLLAVWALAWSAFHFYLVMASYSNAVVLLQYYAINYKYGFVRRGLGGEIISLFPDRDYFTVAYGIVWASALTWLACLAALIWVVLSPNPRSERRRMLSLLIPVLPFSICYAIWNSHPEIWGMAAFVLFGIAMRKVSGRRSRIAACAVYGAVVAVLTLVHEAIPVQFALGAVLAIAVLARDATSAAKRALSLLAVGPGLVTLVLVAVFSRRDIAVPLCAQVPHGRVDDPVGTFSAPHRSLSFLFSGFQRQSDYHDWVCAKTMPYFYMDMTGAARIVASYGFPKLLISILLGILIFFITVAAVRNVCGVPFEPLVREVRNNRLIIIAAAALLLPLFITALDWTRWCTLIALDVTIVYILFAVDRQEIDEGATRRNWKFFVVTMLLLAAIPLGDLNNAGP